MTYRFLFDECLALELMGTAREQGYLATSVRDLGRLGQSDRSLALYAVEHDWTMVTNNRLDYLRLYRQFDLHPGLIVILPSVSPLEQQRLFARMQSNLSNDLTNALVEVDRDGAVTVTDWPPLRPNDLP